MIETIEEEETSKIRQMKEDFESYREGIKNQNTEILETMKHDLIKKIEDLDKEFEVNFNRYISDTDTKAEDYKDLLAKNDENYKIILKKNWDIQRLTDSITYWGIKGQQNKQECDERNKQLLIEKKMILKHYHDLKRKMIQFREDEERRLGNLTMNSKMCMDKLTEYQKLGEKILKTSELCRKLETEKEKVLPFYQADADAQEEVPEFQFEKIDGVKKQKYNEFTLLDSFYKRYNKVLLDKLAIEKQKALQKRKTCSLRVC